MHGINKVIVVGLLGNVPELLIYEKTRRAAFSLAVNERSINKEGVASEHTEWIQVICWNELANSAVRLLSKGMNIYVEGKMRTRIWKDKNGESRRITNVVAERFIPLSPIYKACNTNNHKTENDTEASSVLKSIIENEEDADFLRDLSF